MCVIIYKKQDIELSKDVLTNACEKNPDGLGIAYRDGDLWHVKKTLKPNAEKLASFAKLLQGKEAVIHARIATSGGVTLKNVHPFFDDNFLLFHNGIVSSLNGIDDNQSDTQLLFYLLQNKKVNKRELLTNLATKTGSRFLLIEAKKDPILFGTWQDHKGLKCSNLYFVPIEKTAAWGCASTWGRYSYLSKKIYDSLTEQGFNDADIEDLEQDLICQHVDFSKVFSQKHIDDYITRLKGTKYYNQHWADDPFEDIKTKNY